MTLFPMKEQKESNDSTAGVVPILPAAVKTEYNDINDYYNIKNNNNNNESQHQMMMNRASAVTTEGIVLAANNVTPSANNHNNNQSPTTVIKTLHMNKDAKKAASNNNNNKKGTNTDESNNSGPTNFAQKMMLMLSSQQHSDIVSWLPHGKGFMIHDKKRFASEILPKYFKEAKYTSFTRKLLRWDFRRVTRGPEAGAYYHPLFSRQNPQTSLQMTCSNKAAIEYPQDPAFDGNLGQNNVASMVMTGVLEKRSSENLKDFGNNNKTDRHQASQDSQGSSNKKHNRNMSSVGEIAFDTAVGNNSSNSDSSEQLLQQNQDAMMQQQMTMLLEQQNMFFQQQKQQQEAFLSQMSMVQQMQSEQTQQMMQFKQKEQAEQDREYRRSKKQRKEDRNRNNMYRKISSKSNDARDRKDKELEAQLQRQQEQIKQQQEQLQRQRQNLDQQQKQMNDAINAFSQQQQYFTMFMAQQHQMATMAVNAHNGFRDEQNQGQDDNDQFDTNQWPC